MHSSIVEIPLPVLVTIGLAVMGGFVALIKVVAMQFERSVTAKFAATEQNVHSKFEASNAAHYATNEAHAKQLAAMARDLDDVRGNLHRLQVDLPREFVRRDDYIQALAVVNAKIDNIGTSQQQMLILLGDLKRERASA